MSKGGGSSRVGAASRNCPGRGAHLLADVWRRRVEERDEERHCPELEDVARLRRRARRNVCQRPRSLELQLRVVRVAQELDELRRDVELHDLLDGRVLLCKRGSGETLKSLQRGPIAHQASARTRREHLAKLARRLEGLGFVSAVDVTDKGCKLCLLQHGMEESGGEIKQSRDPQKRQGRTNAPTANPSSHAPSYATGVSLGRRMPLHCA